MVKKLSQLIFCLCILCAWLFPCSEIHASALETLRKHIRFGQCKLDDSVKIPERIEGIAPYLCFNGKAGSEASFTFGQPERHEYLYYGEFYGALHFGPYVSIHGKPKYRRIFNTKHKTELYREASTEYLIAQIGNPVKSKFRLTFGKMRLPFGIDYNPLQETYKVLENRHLWNSPPNAARITYDELRSLQIDLAIATPNTALASKRKRATYEQEKLAADHKKEAGSLRIMSDFPALERSRLVISFWGNRHGEKRLGGGFVRLSSKGEITQFEWIRRFPFKDGRIADFEQILRASHKTHFTGDGRWVFQYDDERFKHRLGVLVYEHRLWDHMLGQVSLAYQKSEIEEIKSRWLMTFGLQAYF